MSVSFEGSWYLIFELLCCFKSAISSYNVICWTQTRVNLTLTQKHLFGYADMGYFSVHVAWSLTIIGDLNLTMMIMTQSLIRWVWVRNSDLILFRLCWYCKLNCNWSDISGWTCNIHVFEMYQLLVQSLGINLISWDS